MIRLHSIPACIGIAILALGLGSIASAQSGASDYAQWAKAHPHYEKDITALKAKTASLLAAHRSAHPNAAAIDTPPAIFRVKGAIREIWDDAKAPRMTIIPAGEYTMGSPDTEKNRHKGEDPLHRVTIAYPFAIGTYHVTRDEYAAFVAETNHPDADHCLAADARSGHTADGKTYNWRAPSFAQTGRDPVVCVTWDDANAYAAWLSKKTGKSYRLLSEAEWEYAARAGTTSAYFYGEEFSHEHANFGNEHPRKGVAIGRDQWVNTSPVGSFPPNAFGLYDMSGNAWQWLGDCMSPNYNGAPVDGSVRLDGNCDQRLDRGGSWLNSSHDVRSAYRFRYGGNDASYNHGFRVGRAL